MFYSHQLLARKAPLGQIWIAATFKAKISRRRLDKLDIIKICEETLNPPVPTALRPSRILMGSCPSGIIISLLSSPDLLSPRIRVCAGGTMQASGVSVIMLQGLGISPPLARMLAEDGFNDGAATGATQPMVSPTWRC
ncbi:hypothetical protein ZWY2020_041286 [Hordeum vulgare]|nr:hypothetical protein ZWY2020_041286 [Hordeum vulgare]